MAAVDTKHGYVGMCNGRSAQQECCMRGQLALLPDRVEPVRSSLFTHTEKGLGRPGKRQRWTGVGAMHSCGEVVMIIK